MSRRPMRLPIVLSVPLLLALEVFGASWALLHVADFYGNGFPEIGAYTIFGVPRGEMEVTCGGHRRWEPYPRSDLSHPPRVPLVLVDSGVGRD